MTWEGKDDRKDYWITEERNLRQGFDRKVRPLIEEGHHFSIFGLAPIPLLIRLGSFFTDKIPAQVYQLRREPEQTWQWDSAQTETIYKVVEPPRYEDPPALIIALSSGIAHERVTSVIGFNVSIWEITIDDQNNDFLTCLHQLSQYRKTIRKLLVRISEKHGVNAPECRRLTCHGSSTIITTSTEPL
jgi:hypothetical protein